MLRYSIALHTPQRSKAVKKKKNIAFGIGFTFHILHYCTWFPQGNGWKPIQPHQQSKPTQQSEKKKEKEKETKKTVDFVVVFLIPIFDILRSHQLSC